MESESTMPGLAVPESRERPPLHRARFAASVIFLIDGMTFGTWAALIPAFKEKFALSEGQLSAVLFGLVGGAMISMFIVGRIIGRQGSGKLASLFSIAFTASLPLLALAPSFEMLIVSGFIFGLAKGGLDVSINTQAIAIENSWPVPIMSGFQGFWSVGGLSAAFITSGLLHFGMPLHWLMIGTAVLLLAASLCCLGQLLPDVAPKPETAAKRPPGKRGRLWLLGLLAFLALFSEGVMLDWSAVYASSVTGVSITVAPLAFAVFAFSMAAGRFLGDRITARLGAVGTLRLSSLLMAAGVAVIVGFQTWPAMLIGSSLVGNGVANLVPVIFGAAGRVEGMDAGSGLATVTTIGYVGFLAGPPLVGMVASHFGLPVAFSLIIVFGMVISTVGVKAITVSRLRS